MRQRGRMGEWNLPESPPAASSDLLVGHTVPAYFGAAQAKILQAPPPPRTRERVDWVSDALRYVNRYNEWRPRILDWSAVGLQDVSFAGFRDCLDEVQRHVGCRHASPRKSGVHPLGPMNRKQTIGCR